MHILANKSHNFFSVSIPASLLAFAFDLLHTTWSHLSPGLTLCPQNSFNLPNPLLSPNVTVIQHVPPLCSLSLPVSLSACLRDFRLTPFVFWCAFFYFQHFTLVHKSLRAAKRKWRKIKPNKFPQLTSRCTLSRSWPLFLGWSIRAQSAVSTEINALLRVTSNIIPLLAQLYDTPCSNLCVCVYTA